MNMRCPNFYFSIGHEDVSIEFIQIMGHENFFITGGKYIKITDWCSIVFVWPKRQFYNQLIAFSTFHLPYVPPNEINRVPLDSSKNTSYFVYSLTIVRKDLGRDLVVFFYGGIHKLRNPLHGLMFYTSHFFSSKSSWTPKTQPNDSRATVWLSF